MGKTQKKCRFPSDAAMATLRVWSLPTRLPTNLGASERKALF